MQRNIPSEPNIIFFVIFLFWVLASSTFTINTLFSVGNQSKPRSDFESTRRHPNYCEGGFFFWVIEIFVFPFGTKRMSGIVVVFDFDKTIVDCDSDNWVIDELGFTDLFNELLPTMLWNSLMDRMMMELHSQGITIKDIEEVLQRIPMHPRIIPAIKAAHALGCELRIVSDANLFFIEAILKHLGIREYFSEINTNPGYVNEEGRLRILPYHDFNKASHGCNLCPPNMCKGLIIDRIQDSISPEDDKRLIYLGDGSGDYCPSLRLKERDFMMPRKNFPVWDLICKDPLLLKAEIHGWSDGEELEQVLLQLINKISMDQSSQFISPDCKLQTLSVSAPEALPKVLSVRP